MLHKEAVSPILLELLEQLCSIPALQNFALGGGTNIALHNGHRISVDLDFFTNTEYDTQEVFKIISKEFPHYELLFEQNQTILFFLNGIRVDFVLYPFKWIYPFEQIENTRLIHIEDIIPMKLQAVANRCTKKDFWDIAFMLDSFSLEKMFQLFTARFPQIDVAYIVQALVNFDGAEENPDPETIIECSWQSIKQKLTKAVENFTKNSL